MRRRHAVVELAYQFFGWLDDNRRRVKESLFPVHAAELAHAMGRAKAPSPF
jgi:hypothetical protein